MKKKLIKITNCVCVDPRNVRMVWLGCGEVFIKLAGCEEISLAPANGATAEELFDSIIEELNKWSEKD